MALLSYLLIYLTLYTHSVNANKIGMKLRRVHDYSCHRLT